MCRDQREIYENIKLKNPGLIAIFDLSDVGQVGHFPREKVGQVGHFSSGKVGQVGYFEHFLNQNFGQFNTLKMKIRDVEANRSVYILLL